MSSHLAGSGKQCPVLPGRSQHGPESTPGQLSGKRGIMGSRTPDPGVHHGKPTPGSKSRNSTHSDQNPATCNATSASGTTCMKKPRPTNQHQRSIGSLTTSIGNPTTPESGTNPPMTETPGATHDARNEAATGAITMPHIPKATGTRTRGRTGRRSPHDTTRIICRATRMPAV